MTRAVFINPSWDRYVSRRGKRYNRYWPPLDLLSCAGMLERHGVQCSVHDQRVSGSEAISLADADWVFITSSALDRWQCPNLDLELFAERTRRLPPERTVILGAHGTMDPEHVLKLTGAAGVIREEPEVPVLRLALGDSLASVPSLSYRDGERIVHNPSQSPPPLDELVPPAYRQIDIGRYGYELLGPNFALLETSRGCPHACTYCYLGMYPKYRMRSPDRVVDEVRAALQAGARNIYFIDLEFAIHRRHCEAVLDALIASNLRFQWCCQTRADSVDAELLARMKRAGCRLVHYGVETASRRIMEMVNKRLELADVRAAIRLTREAGLHSACFFMLGFPTETEGEIHETLRFARELNPTFASFHIATPYRGTDMYRDFQSSNSGHFIEETYRQALPLPRLKALEKEAYLRYYLRPGYALSRLLESPAETLQQLRLFWNFLSAN